MVAEALGMRVLSHHVVDRLPLGNARRCGTLTELLARADVVSLHVDGRAENAGLIGEAERGHAAGQLPAQPEPRARRRLVTEHGVYIRECGNKLGITSQYVRLVVRPADDVARLIEGLHAYAATGTPHQ